MVDKGASIKKKWASAHKVQKTSVTHRKDSWFKEKISAFCGIPTDAVLVLIPFYNQFCYDVDYFSSLF